MDLLGGGRALWLGIIVLEQTALLGIVGAASQQKRMGVRRALRFAAANSRSVFLVAARLVIYTLLLMAPFLVLAGLVYRQLLTKFDINYYLKEWPGEFQLAVALGVVLVAVLASLLLWFAASWLFALPLVLFEGVSHANALRVSRERAAGHRRRLLLWIGGWVSGNDRPVGIDEHIDSLSWAIVCAACDGFVVAVDGRGRKHASSMGGSRSGGKSAEHHRLRCDAVPSLPAIRKPRKYRSVAIERGGRRSGRSWPIIDPSKAFGHCRRECNPCHWDRHFLIRSVRLDDKAVIMAHRGSSTVAPENTMAAVKQAIEDGADWVEIDVQETADGEVVVMHDSDFMKLAGVDLKIWNATRAELEEIDIGSWFDPTFKDERVPKLQDVLTECKGKIGVNIELKYYGHDDQLEQRVVEIVESLDMASNVVVMSLKTDAVKKMKSLRPSWKVGQLMSVSAGDLQNIEADFVAVNASFADRSFVRSAHKIGKEVYVWTVNDAPTMSAMMSRGVDGIITDKPALARSVLELRSALSPAERVLLELAGILGVTPEIDEI